jgi:chromosome segregation ATPase
MDKDIAKLTKDIKCLEKTVDSLEKKINKTHSLLGRIENKINYFLAVIEDLITENDDEEEDDMLIADSDEGEWVTDPDAWKNDDDDDGDAINYEDS